ncbi:hypothetical protein CHU95_05760 [Niveispirillum lacus]|uniref:DUF445 domain-containing protein n=1 Tax=Niveispirillum lacus TaxID=1981099 RepID=A0A255Z4D6_9PROT|nr:DUF445 domain-containing protein [Niveispirillum lacus]OYQ35784.1 hypothetical protein CHU95_05760 [Niveispirillum lacus]
MSSIDPSPNSLPDPADDDSLARDLSRHRWLAGGCLALAAGGWAVSHAPFMPAGIAPALRAIAEAGMVGGLADWFAVTALFRRPLGLPIPHTALVPRNRDRIADGIAAYIDREFLEPAMLVEQVRRMDPAARIAGLLADPADRGRMVDLVAGMLPGLLSSQGDAPLAQALGRALAAGLSQADLRPALAGALRHFVNSDALEPLLREVVDRLIHLVHSKRGFVEAAVAGKSRWWMPSSVDKSLADTINEAVLGHLWDLRSPHAPAGQELRDWLKALPDEVADGSELAQRLLEALRQFTGPTVAGPLLHDLLAGLRDAALRDLERADGHIRSALHSVAESLAGAMQEPPVRDRLNQAVEQAFTAALPRWRQAIREFVAKTLKAQDVGEFTRRLELRVGRDLQYIRINGTLLGAAIGGLLYGLNTWLAG